MPRAIVHRIADGAVPACGGQPPVHQHDHPLGHPLDLVEHVRADDHRPPLAPSCLNSVDQVQALHRVGAVQRLVEHEHLRIGDQRRGDLGSLAHALAEAVDPPVGGVEHGDALQSLVGRAAIGDAVNRSAM